LHSVFNLHMIFYFVTNSIGPLGENERGRLMEPRAHRCPPRPTSLTSHDAGPLCLAPPACSDTTASSPPYCSVTPNLLYVPVGDVTLSSLHWPHAPHTPPPPSPAIMSHPINVNVLRLGLCVSIESSNFLRKRKNNSFLC
jgi:hypothetical protein